MDALYIAKKVYNECVINDISGGLFLQSFKTFGTIVTEKMGSKGGDEVGLAFHLLSFFPSILDSNEVIIGRKGITSVYCFACLLWKRTVDRTFGFK